MRTACMYNAVSRASPFLISVSEYMTDMSRLHNYVCLLDYLIIGLSSDILYLIACVLLYFSLYILHSNLNSGLASFDPFYILCLYVSEVMFGIFCECRSILYLVYLCHSIF